MQKNSWKEHVKEEESTQYSSHSMYSSQDKHFFLFSSIGHPRFAQIMQEIFYPHCLISATVVQSTEEADQGLGDAVITGF